MRLSAFLVGLAASASPVMGFDAAFSFPPSFYQSNNTTAYEETTALEASENGYLRFDGRAFNATGFGCPKWILYKQCGESWSNDRLGTSSKNTICTAGCAMSSVSMYLQTRGISSNPGSLNAWLTKNGGYVSGDEL